MRCLTTPIAGLTLVAAVACAASGCSGPEGSDGSETGVDLPLEPSVPCASPVAFFPEDGAIEVMARTGLWIRWDEKPVHDVVVTVRGADGQPIPGAFTMDDEQQGRFTPTNSWNAEADHDVQVDWLCGQAQWTFGSGPVHAALTDEATILDRVFELELDEGDVYAPPEGGPLLGLILADDILLVSAVASSSLPQHQLHLLGGTGDIDADPLAQDTCKETFPFTFGADRTPHTDDDVIAAWANPEFKLGPADLTLVIGGEPTDIEGMVLQGRYAPELGQLLDVTFQGTLDTRAFVKPDQGDNYVCGLIELLLGENHCIPCTSDDERYCLFMHIENVRSLAVDTSLVDRTCSQIIADEACDPTDFDEDGDGTLELCPEHESNSM